MINNISSFSNNSFCGALKDLSFGRLLNSCGFNKKRGVPILIVMYGLLTAVFNYSGIHQKTQSRKGYSQCNCTDQVFYDITSNPKLNWRKLCLLLAQKLIRKITPTMTCAKCFVLDDTIMERPRSKKVELLSRTYDHVSHRQVKGFTNLLLAWTDGLSSVPVINAVVSSSKIICPERNDIDKRTHGAERRKEQEIFKCVKCGYEANADYNAAQNILRRAGLARMARQANLNRGRQQELAEAYNSSSIVV